MKKIIFVLLIGIFIVLSGCVGGDVVYGTGAGGGSNFSLNLSGFPILTSKATLSCGTNMTCDQIGTIINLDSTGGGGNTYNNYTNNSYYNTSVTGNCNPANEALTGNGSQCISVADSDPYILLSSEPNLNVNHSNSTTYWNGQTTEIDPTVNSSYLKNFTVFNGTNIILDKYDNGSIFINATTGFDDDSAYLPIATYNGDFPNSTIIAMNSSWLSTFNGTYDGYLSLISALQTNDTWHDSNISQLQANDTADQAYVNNTFLNKSKPMENVTLPIFFNANYNDNIGGLSAWDRHTNPDGRNQGYNFWGVNRVWNSTSSTISPSDHPERAGVFMIIAGIDAPDRAQLNINVMAPGVYGSVSNQTGLSQFEYNFGTNSATYSFPAKNSTFIVANLSGSGNAVAQTDSTGKLFTNRTVGAGIPITSPNGNNYCIHVSNLGVLSADAGVC